MKIFIGSSSEQRDLATKVAGWLSDANVDPVLWCNETTFTLTQFTWESLIDIAHSVDAAIFIFSADDLSWLNGVEKGTVRDNVILEYGLFSGVLSKNNVCFIRSKDADIPSDLRGVTYADIKNQYTAELKIKEWIKELNNKCFEKNKCKGSFKLVSLGTALSSVLQKQNEFDSLRVYAISTARSAMMLRGYKELKVKKASVLLREYKEHDKYYEESMEGAIERAIAVWNKMKDLGNISELDLRRFDFHPTCGFYIFDDHYLAYGNLSYSVKNNEYAFEDEVLFVEANSESEKQFIDNCITFFDDLFLNYE